MADTTVGLTAKLTFMADQAIAGMQKVGTVFKGVKDGFQQSKGGFTQVKEGLAGLKVGGVVAGLGLGVSVKKFAEFDEVMAGMRATLGEEYRKDFPALESAARDMGTKTGKSVMSIAEAMRALSQEGMKPQEILASIGPTMNAMSAAGIDAATAAKLVDTTLDKFGLTAGQAGVAMDALVYAARKSGASLPEFAMGVNNLAGTAQLLKLDIKDVSAGLGLFVKGGLDAGAASQNLNMALLKLSRASKQGWIDVAGLGRIEVATKDGALDLQTTMMNVAAALKYVKDPAQRVNLAMSLFGMRGRESAAAMEKLTADPAALPTLFKNIREKSDGAAAAMAKLKNEGPAGQFKKLKNAMSNVSIEIGSAFLPFVSQAVNALVPLGTQIATALRFFTSTPDAVNKTGVTIAGVSPTIVGLAQGLSAGFKGVYNAMGWIAGGVKSLGGLFGGGGPGGSGVKTAVEWAVKLAAVSAGYKLLAPVVKNAMNVGIGAGKMLLGGLTMLQGATTGVLGTLAKRFPAISRVLPGATGALGKALSAAEKVTAQPVRIVNWDEAGAGIGGGVAPGQLSLPGMGKPGAPGGAPAGGGVRGAVGMGVGVAAAVGGGIALNMIQGEIRGPVKTLGNTVLGVASMFGPVGMAVGGVAAGAMALGSKIDEWTGASDKISTYLFNQADAQRKIAWNAYLQAYQGDLNLKAMQGTADQLLKFAQQGVAVQTEAGGPKRAVTAELMQERLMKYATSKNAGMTPEQAQSMVKAIMDNMGPKLAEAMKNVKVESTVKIGEREVGRSVAGTNQETGQRRGATERPGARTKAAS